MRILEVIPSYLPAVRYGGPVLSTHALSKALIERGHEVQVYTTYRGQTLGERLPPKTELDGVMVNYFEDDRSARLSWAPELARKLGREISKFDVVHLHTVFLWPTWCAARQARAKEIPYVLSPRGMLVKNLIRRRNRAVKSAWIQLVEKRNLKCASAIHVTSTKEAEDLDEMGWALPNVVNIPNGVEWNEPEGPVNPEISVIAQNKPYLLFFGRLSWKKGIDTLLEGFARTTTGNLVIAGTDDEGLSPALNISAERLGIAGRTHIIPRTIAGADKYRLFQSAQAFVLPSLSENFGNTVLEAMAAGLPVVVTPEVGAAEIVRQAKAGLVVLKDPGALAQAFETLLSNESHSRQIGGRGRKYVQGNCSWGSVAARMEALYQSCALSAPTSVRI